MQSKSYYPVSNIWRTGKLEIWSPVYGEWVRQNHTVTIKPNEDPAEVAAIAALEYRVGVAVPKARITIWDR